MPLRIEEISIAIEQCGSVGPRTCSVVLARKKVRVAQDYVAASTYLIGTKQVDFMTDVATANGSTWVEGRLLN